MTKFNKSGIIIDVTFTFDRLIKVLQKAPDDFFFEGELEPYLNKAVAKAAKEKIKKGNAGRKLKPSTVEIRKKRGQQPGPPLLATGKLMKSIEGRKDGVYVEDYGINHLDGYTVKKNSSRFTKFWKKSHRVPKRNFLPTREKLDIGDGQRFLTRKINRLMKKTGK
tara:strand:+ start:651 stop:1145 length:495 start_codon:yes stop_codon:yes gene_type:complete